MAQSQSIVAKCHSGELFKGPGWLAAGQLLHGD